MPGPSRGFYLAVSLANKQLYHLEIVRGLRIRLKPLQYSNFLGRRGTVWHKGFASYAKTRTYRFIFNSLWDFGCVPGSQDFISGRRSAVRRGARKRLAPSAA